MRRAKPRAGTTRRLTPAGFTVMNAPMSSIRHLCFAASMVALLTARPAVAQVEHDSGAWLNLTVQGPIGTKLAYFLEAQPRVQEDFSRLDQMLLRGALGYKVTRRLTLYQGYAHVFLPVDGGADRNEERSFQQATWVVPGLSCGEVQSRTRLEQRWRSDADGMQVRVREMIRFEYPLGRGDGIRALTSVEGFAVLNRTGWRRDTGFDQVRTFLGTEIPVGGGASTIEAGYLNQIVDQPGAASRMNHILSLSLFVRR
jgi:hypothetical protein